MIELCGEAAQLESIRLVCTIYAVLNGASHKLSVGSACASCIKLALSAVMGFLKGLFT